MEAVRKPLQGLWNVTRFNWHFYLLSGTGIVFLLFVGSFLQQPYHFYVTVICLLILASTMISLLVSFYVYDVSGLYKLDWLNEFNLYPNAAMANINAGFDETSSLLKQKFSPAVFRVFDFYDPLRHTEVSIKRARKAYPPFPGTEQINTCQFPVHNNSLNAIFLIFAAHEIRQEKERVVFFTALEKALAQNGRLIVTEHLRDLPNFIAYNIGYFHFLSRASWYRVFEKAGLQITAEKKITPFVTSFILTKYGTAS